MNVKLRRLLSGSAPFLSGALAILLAIAIVSSPEASFQASLQGLKLWWNLVFPALLPFLILSEMLSASGFVHGFGVMLEPLMRRVFRLPGESAWTLVLGLTSGFPGGAQSVLLLHKQGRISDKEAGRLAALVHFGSPVTLLIVIGVAFLHSPAAGYGLLAVHWISGLLAGLMSALPAGAGNKSAASFQRNNARTPSASLRRRILNAASEARAQDGRSFGRLLGDSVGNSVQSLMMAGGYMIMFAVVISIICGVFPGLQASLAAGVLEIHLGARALTEAAATARSGWAEPFSLAILSAALGWSGLCAHLQVLATLKPARIKYLPFAAARIRHALYAFLLTLLLWKPFMSLQAAALPAIANSETLQGDRLGFTQIWNSFPQWMGLQIGLLLLLLLLSGFFTLISVFRGSSG